VATFYWTPNGLIGLQHRWFVPRPGVGLPTDPVKNFPTLKGLKYDVTPRSTSPSTSPPLQWWYLVHRFRRVTPRACWCPSSIRAIPLPAIYTHQPRRPLFWRRIRPFDSFTEHCETFSDQSRPSLSASSSTSVRSQGGPCSTTPIHFPDQDDPLSTLVVPRSFCTVLSTICTRRMHIILNIFARKYINLLSYR
jgi:hypothetical protein